MCKNIFCQFCCRLGVSTRCEDLVGFVVGLVFFQFFVDSVFRLGVRTQQFLVGSLFRLGVRTYRKLKHPITLKIWFLFPRSVQGVFNWMTRGFKLIFMTIKFVDVHSERVAPGIFRAIKNRSSGSYADVFYSTMC